MKGIENKKIYHDHFHVRFFRVVFNSGKFVVKTDRRDKKMKSFPLSDLESVECIDKSIEGLDADEEKTAQRAAIISKDDIIESSYLEMCLRYHGSGDPTMTILRVPILATPSA